MYVYTAEEIGKIDQQAEEQGFHLFALMENAGRGIAEALKPLMKKDEHILILAGRGNNGSDGIVVARYLKEAGFPVTLTFPLGEPKTDTAKAHLAYYQQQFTVEPWKPEIKADVLLDALLGVGVQPPLRRNAASIINWANEQSARRYAIDIPSGVGADNGEVVDAETDGPEQTRVQAFHAEKTFALHGAKPSAFLVPASAFYGKVVPVDIGLKQASNIRTTEKTTVRQTMPARSSTSHKGTFGTSFLVAGSDEMPGSALLAATGAIRSGTGLLVMGTTKFAASIIATGVPEATYMLDGLKRVGDNELPMKMSAAGIGPGLSDKRLIKQALDRLMETEVPLVIDAGALLEDRSWKREAATVLTPHPGEFSKLTGKSIKHIQENRIKVAREFARKEDVILVLKGAYTVIAFPEGSVRINPTGNSGLAKGGSGDVLTGMITSFLSYYESPEAAVTNAVYLHGLCAEYWAAENSEAAMTASDFAFLLPQVMQAMEHL